MIVFGLHANLDRSHALSRNVIIPLVRNACGLGPCWKATPDQDMREKVDVVCESCCDPHRTVRLAIRAQVGKYHWYRTHTLRVTEVERIRDPQFPVPDWYVHAYMPTEKTVSRIGIIAGSDMREIVLSSRSVFQPAEGQRGRFCVIPWETHAWAVKVLEFE